jgi:hypothetical protein
MALRNATCHDPAKGNVLNPANCLGTFFPRAHTLICLEFGLWVCYIKDEYEAIGSIEKNLLILNKPCYHIEDEALTCPDSSDGLSHGEPEKFVSSTI